MKKKAASINILITIAYLILISLLIFNIFELPDKYNKEELNMVVEVEKRIQEALDLKEDDLVKNELSNLRKEYNFDIVLTRGTDIIYKTVPYEMGDSLLNRSHPDIIAREAQGPYNNHGDEIFMWYSVYRLNDSVFINKFLTTIVLIVLLVTALLALTIFLITKSLMDPLKNIRKSIEKAQDYDFEGIEETDDQINKSFKTFVSGLEENIDVVSRQHTELEKQLQAKREHLNNVLVVSRSMIHDLKTPIYRNIIENEVAENEASDNTQLVELAQLNQELNHSIMLDINRILKMLKEDGEKTELDITDVDVINTIMRAINTFNKKMDEKELTLDFDAPEDVIMSTEESTFILLINNLLSNMVIYSKEQSELQIYVDVEDKDITLRFINSAAKENIERMKDTGQLFNKVKSPTEDKYVYGSGNGLFLIKELARILGGEYKLDTTEDSVIIEVVFKHEEE